MVSRKEYQEVMELMSTILIENIELEIRRSSPDSTIVCISRPVEIPNNEGKYKIGHTGYIIFEQKGDKTTLEVRLHAKNTHNSPEPYEGETAIETVFNDTIATEEAEMWITEFTNLESRQNERRRRSEENYRSKILRIIK